MPRVLLHPPIARSMTEGNPLGQGTAQGHSFSGRDFLADFFIAVDKEVSRYQAKCELSNGNKVTMLHL
jgi:hypothetical protein